MIRLRACRTLWSSYELVCVSTERTAMVHLLGVSKAHVFIATGGLLSALACAALLLHLAHIAILDARGSLQSTSRKRALRFVTSPNGNLLLSLLVADLLAGLGLRLVAHASFAAHGCSISFNWIVGNRADFPLRQIPAICTVQGVLIQVGETGGALSTFAIAVHTAFLILFSRQPSLAVVRVVISMVWALVAFLAIIGPAALVGDLSLEVSRSFSSHRLTGRRPVIRTTAGRTARCAGTESLLIAADAFCWVRQTVRFASHRADLAVP